MDKVIAGSGIDAVIYRVSQKANISEQAATVAVDEVLTAVKDRLPPAMAAKLVTVVAGEDAFSSWNNIGDKLRAAQSIGKNLSTDGIAELSQRIKQGAVHSGQLSKQYAARVADKVTTWWGKLRARRKKTRTKRGVNDAARHD